MLPGRVLGAAEYLELWVILESRVEFVRSRSLDGKLDHPRLIKTPRFADLPSGVFADYAEVVDRVVRVWQQLNAASPATATH
jgi:hypothetical protein